MHSYGAPFEFALHRFGNFLLFFIVYLRKLLYTICYDEINVFNLLEKIDKDGSTMALLEHWRKVAYNE